MEPGTRLGPYEVLEQLGAGGMGEVYLAQDTRLDRRVAIKVLPEEFAGDADRLARFDREARAAAALNHPNIAAVFDVGREDGTHFFVQEFLDGQSLRDLLRDSPPKLERAVHIGADVAEALAVAHRAGIVHRDIKPENIFVTDAGHTKVLDFGLAKLVETRGIGAGSDATMSPTAIGTVPGAVMGTVGYMAPEQIEGAEIDGRADIFALGCVLYEMTTGRRPFEGKNVHTTLGLILSDDPEPLAVARPGLPSRLEWVTSKCLARNPARRYQHAEEAGIDLRALAADLESGEVALESALSVPARGLSLRYVVGLMLIAAVLGGLGTRLASDTAAPSEPDPVRFSLGLPGVEDFSNTNNRVLAVSPDGRSVAITAGGQLWLRNLNSHEYALLEGTEGGRTPAFSPGGEALAYWADGAVRRVSIRAGTSVPLAEHPGRPQGLSWATDGFVYVGGPQGISRVASGGGELELVSDWSGDSRVVHGPVLLPGNEWLIYAAAPSWPQWRTAEVLAESLDSGERRVLVRGGHHPLYSPTGHLLYVSGEGRALMAQRLDLTAMTVSGVAVPLFDDLRVSTGRITGTAMYDLSDTGTLVYVRGDRDSGLTRFAWTDEDGGTDWVALPPARYGNAYSVSPRGEHLAWEIRAADGLEVWVGRTDGTAGQRLSTEPGATYPVWSPDGRFVYFAGGFGSPERTDLRFRRADLSEPPEVLFNAPGAETPTSVSPDGAWLYYVRGGLAGMPQGTETAGGLDIWRLPLPEGEPEQVVATAANETRAVASADGRYLAYQSDETGAYEVYVLDLETRQRYRVSSAGGTHPHWSTSEARIFYEGPDGVWAASYSADSEFLLTPPGRVRRHPSGRMISDLVLSADGSRSLERFGGGADPALTSWRVDVVINWFTELRRAAGS